ncbi:MAG: hypothetical protein ACOCUY_03465 [Verrucomicrobiota bacterium]
MTTSFRECLDRRDIPRGPISSRLRSRIQNAFADYWETGGFPEVAEMSPRLRVMTHQEYFKTIVHRDVVERYRQPIPVCNPVTGL